MTKKTVILGLLAVVALMLGGMPVLAAPAPPKIYEPRAANDYYPDRANDALFYLRGKINDDGSFTPSFGSTVGYTCEAVLAIVAAGEDPDTFLGGANNSPLDYIRTAAASDTETDTTADASNVSLAGKLALCLVAAGKDPGSYIDGGVDLVSRIDAAYDGGTGWYGTGSDYLQQSWAMLGWAAAGQTPYAAAVTNLQSLQAANGAYGSTGYESADDTALVIQALIASGVDPSDASVADGLTYIKTQQGADGGIQSWGVSNTNSTAWSVMAVVAAGQNPDGAAWESGGKSMMDFLKPMPAGNGYFRYSTVDPGFDPDVTLSTFQGIQGIMGRPFAARDGADGGLGYLKSTQGADGSWTPGFGSAVGLTCDVIVAIAAGGEGPDGADWQGTGGDANTTPVLYVRDNSDTLTDEASEVDAAGKVAVAMMAAGRSAADISTGGWMPYNLLSRIDAAYNAGTGAYGDGDYLDQSWAMLGLAAAGQAIPGDAVTYLEGLQTASGGFGFAGWESADDTSLALMALVAGGRTTADASVQDAVAFIKTQQGADGGIQSFGLSNANSTAWSIEGLSSAGVDPCGNNWQLDNLQNWDTGDVTPMVFLKGLQDGDGSFAYSYTDPGFAPDLNLTTAQTVVAIQGGSYLLREDRTVPGRASVRSYPGLFEVTAPFYRDFNGNVTAQIEYRSLGSTGAWSGPFDMHKGHNRFAYVLDAGAGDYEIRVTYTDADGFVYATRVQTTGAARRMGPLFLRRG